MNVGWSRLGLRNCGLVGLVFMGLSSSAMAEEVWVLPDSQSDEVGNWATSGTASSSFTFSVPDDFDSFDGAKILAIGASQGGGASVVDLEIGVSVSSSGLGESDLSDSGIQSASLTEGMLTEVDVSGLLDIAYLPGTDYVTVRVASPPGNSSHLQLVGMRFQYTSNDADRDPTNELNTSVSFDGVNVGVTDAGGTLTADLSSLEESADILAEEVRAMAAEAALAADIAAEEARALAAEAALAADIAAEEARALAAEAALGADIAAEETRALAAEAALGADIAAEEARATAAEAALAADIASEEARALAAEALLASDILAEEMRAMAAEADLAADISAEEARALAAEAALAADIATNQADITAHISADGDLDSSNELVTDFSLAGTNLSLTDAGSSFLVSLAGLEESADIAAEAARAIAAENAIESTLLGHIAADGDLDSSNELQTVSLSGSTVTLSNGGGAFSINDADADSTNELQTLSIAGSTLTLSNGNSVALPVTGDNLGNHVAMTTISTNGNDLDIGRGDIGNIRSVGRISFDWTSGVYDNASYHGFESENEGGAMADSMRINSYNDVTVTIDTNNNNSFSYFTVQHHSIGNGTDLFWVSSSGRVFGRHEGITSGAVTSYDDDGSQDCPSSRIARGFDADDSFGLIDRIRLNCAYVQ